MMARHSVSVGRAAFVAALTLSLLLSHASGAKDPDHSFTCTPKLPVFCRNIHVACSGRTSIPAIPFIVSITDRRASVQFGPGAPAVPGRVDDNGQMVIRLGEGRDWIHIEQDGSYSHRIYQRDQAAMSAGTCEANSSE